MTSDEGAQRLVFHTTPSAGSFLGMLRPYGGLKRDVLADVRDALMACASTISGERLPRELAAAAWAVSYYGRCWGVEPDGMLRGNGLIDDADLKELGRFLDWFDWAVVTLLDARDSRAAFEENPYR